MATGSERSRMFVHRIVLRKILSFGPDTQELALAPLKVFIGPNGSGKSNLVDAIGLLRAAPADKASISRYSTSGWVSALTGQPHAIVTCERRVSGTELRRLDPKQLASWLEEYRLGDLWRMGELGANP